MRRYWMPSLFASFLPFSDRFPLTPNRGVFRQKSATKDRFSIRFRAFRIVALFLCTIAVAHSAPLTPTSRDYDLCARTVWGEARSQDQAEQAAIVHVAYNRWRSGRWGKRFEDVFLARRQFSTWNPEDRNLQLIANLDLDHRNWRFKRALMICAVTINSRDFGAPDPTHGRMHFYHGRVPYWAKGRASIKIGAATFVRTR